MKYETREIREIFGKWTLRVECLRDLNQTIDQLFSKIDGTSDPSELERLCPYFGAVWPAARALGHYIVDQGTSAWNGSRVLELGCGLAIPSFLTAKLGARVVAADFHPDVRWFFERNRNANGLHREVEYVECDWSGPGVELGKFDWVIGSDVLYENTHSELLAKQVDRYLNENGKAVITDPARPYVQAFTDAMKRLGYRVEMEVRTVRDQSDEKEILTLEFTR